MDKNMEIRSYRLHGNKCQVFEWALVGLRHPRA